MQHSLFCNTVYIVKIGLLVDAQCEPKNPNLIWEEHVAFAQLHNNVSNGFNGTPHIYFRNCPSPSTITTPFNVPIPRATPLTTPNGIQIHSAVCHSSLSVQHTDRHTYRLTVSDALKTRRRSESAYIRQVNFVRNNGP